MWESWPAGLVEPKAGADSRADPPRTALPCLPPTNVAELRTFVFTDLVGSVNLKSEMPGGSDAERDAAFVTQILMPHRERIEGYAVDFGGRVVSTAGDGHFLVFADAASAARWSIEIIRCHEDEPLASQSGTQAQLRISMHLGSPQIDPRDPHNFIGKAVDYAARLNDFSSSGQILISRAARAILEDTGLNNVAFYAHGRRHLKGIGDVEVHELLFDGRDPHDTRQTPKAEQPRDWTVHPDTVSFDKLAGLLPDGKVPASSTAVRQTKLGNYELGELVGAGGMGDVFKARHSQFGRLRAVKVIKPHLVAAGQHEVVKRFYQEIKAIGGLEHPNIVVAIDSSTPDDQTHFLVMEYVDGVSAGEMVDRFGPMSIANACEIARQTALGLEYIARQGMVHRDIKPSNVMVTTVATPHLISTDSGGAGARQPLIKILDLGLALLVGDDHERLTRLDHRAMGTAMYMSPEQWRTTSVDIRSDIYSLGCTLYHLISGKPPFFDSELRPEKAHEKSKVPPIRGGKEIPRPLWNTIRKALSKNPDERFASPAEFAEELSQYAIDNTLVELVEQSRRKPSSEPTLPGHTSDTMAANGTHSDTLLAGPSPGSTLTATPAATRRWLWGISAALLAAVVVGGWFADQASRRWRDYQHSQATLQSEKRFAASLAAGTAAEDVGREINGRFRELIRLAQSSTNVIDDNTAPMPLQSYVTQISNQGPGKVVWKPLQDWIVSQYDSLIREFPAESLFIVALDGTQVARAPHSKSIGKNYAHRDYFHGQGADLEEGATGVEPLKEPHRSAVYESTTTKVLKVAFSVPLYDSPRPISTSKVTGVLAMSVDLGDFKVLENQKLPAEKEVLLVDMRTDEIDGPLKRGLILHYNNMAGRNAKGDLNRLPQELVDRIDTALNDGENIVIDYADPLGRPENQDKKFWCAFAEVVIPSRGLEEPIETKWVVLVQEKL